jgi:hypothetical protein
MMPQNMKSWSIAINDSKANLEMAPTALAKTLMVSKPSQKNPLREIPRKTPVKEPHLMQLTPQNPSPFFQTYPPPLPYYHPYLNNAPQYPQMPSLYTYPPLRNTSTDVDQRNRQRSLSLPLAFEDMVDKLEDYFMWLSRIAPGMREQLTECLALLKKRDIVFDTLSSITDAHYI